MKALKKKVIAWRALWFVVGGGISSSLNGGAYHFLHFKAGLRPPVAYAFSLSMTMAVLSMWNYHVNFRTQHRFRECLLRYVIAVCLCTLANYAIVAPLIRSWGKYWFFLILLVQMPMGLFKFSLYHFWVYPRDDEFPESEPG